MSWSTIAVCAATLLAGIWIGMDIKDADLQKFIARQERNARIATEAYKKDTRELNAKLSKAVAEIALLRDRRSNVSARLARVRINADALRRELSEASKDSCRAEKEAIARCAGLLEEGSELLVKGCEVSHSIAIRNDAMINLTK